MEYDKPKFHIWKTVSESMVIQAHSRNQNSQVILRYTELVPQHRAQISSLSLLSDAVITPWQKALHSGKVYF